MAAQKVHPASGINEMLSRLSSDKSSVNKLDEGISNSIGDDDVANMSDREELFAYSPKP